jgi:hypothetical protein
MLYANKLELELDLTITFSICDLQNHLELILTLIYYSKSWNREYIPVMPHLKDILF